MKIVEKIKDLLDPEGPIGSILSPADVFKERAGLPVSSPISARPHFQKAAIVLAPARFVATADAVPPASRQRVVSQYVEEVWSPVYEKTESKNFAAILRASQTLVGWTVEERLRDQYCDCASATLERDAQGLLVHRACGRERNKLGNEDFAEHILRLHIAPSDDYFNTHYPTIPGSDIPIVDGKPLRGTPTYDESGKMTHDGYIRGGTNITGGRREYREKTKGFIHWDKGYVKERDKAYAEEQQKPIKAVRERVLKASRQLLPQKLGEL